MQISDQIATDQKNKVGRGKNETNKCEPSAAGLIIVAVSRGSAHRRD
jgi:hypothetical protein